nr:hypothetical protein [Tanacetum cinerariifolium]
MLNDAIKQLESYKMFIKYSTESKPEPAKKKIASRRVVKKKFTISDDNIIPDLDIALELGKYISLAEAEEEEAAKQVYDTHARSVTEFVPESAKKKTGSRSSRSVVIQDTPSAPKPKPITSNPKLKDVQSLTPAEKEATGIMQALKESKKTNKRQAGSKQESKYSEEDPNEKEDIDWIDYEEDEEKKVDTDDDKCIDLEMTDDKETDDEVLQGDAEVYDVAKADVEKTEEAKDGSKKPKLPPTSFGLSISSGFDIKIQSKVLHIQSSSMFKVHVSVIFKPSILTPIQETPSATPVRTLHPLSISTIPPAPLVTDIFKRQNPSKTKQNRARNEKRGKVKSQPSQSQRRSRGRRVVK